MGRVGLTETWSEVLVGLVTVDQTGGSVVVLNSETTEEGSNSGSGLGG